jgi:hypothetical protein
MSTIFRDGYERTVEAHSAANLSIARMFREVLSMKWFARSLCLLLLVALCGQSWAHPLHVKTQITEVFTGWEADKFGIITVDPVANPAKCKLDTHGYMTDGKQPGYHTFYAAALAAFAQRATVIVVVDETECVGDRPKLIGLNIMRYP